MVQKFQSSPSNQCFFRAAKMHALYGRQGCLPLLALLFLLTLILSFTSQAAVVVLDYNAGLAGNPAVAPSPSLTDWTPGVPTATRWRSMSTSPQTANEKPTARNTRGTGPGPHFATRSIYPKARPPRAFSASSCSGPTPPPRLWSRTFELARYLQSPWTAKWNGKPPGP